MNIEDIRLTRDDIQVICDELVSQPNGLVLNDFLKEKFDTATDKANKWWIEWVEEALLVHPDNRRTWVVQYFEALKKLVKDR